jgi:hypothetical protein
MQVMTAVSARERRASVAALLQARAAGCFANAGRTYTCGNALALVAAAVTAVGGSDRAGLFVNLRQTFFGSTPALAMSFASLAFLLCGAAYDRAHRPAGAANDRYLRAGHALSAIGAATMAFGVAELAVTPLAFDAAVTGGALHVGGKLGALVDGRSGIWRVLPLLSRVLALVSLGADVATDPNAAHMAVAAMLAVCVGIWARADAMLLADRQARWIAAALGLARGLDEKLGNAQRDL